MESPGHRENILNPAFPEVGIGLSMGRYAAEPGTTTRMYVVDFGAPSSRIIRVANRGEGGPHGLVAFGRRAQQVRAPPQVPRESPAASDVFVPQCKRGKRPCARRDRLPSAVSKTRSNP
jgi:hypothetical protein